MTSGHMMTTPNIFLIKYSNTIVKIKRNEKLASRFTKQNNAPEQLSEREVID